MPDQLTQLEIKLDDRYVERRDRIANAAYVLSWDEYNFRAEYLEAIRDVGAMIKEVKNPEAPKETGEIPSILDIKEV